MFRFRDYILFYTISLIYFLCKLKVHFHSLLIIFDKKWDILYYDAVCNKQFCLTPVCSKYVSFKMYYLYFICIILALLP